MRLINRYLQKEFIKPLLLSVFIFTMLGIVTEIFEDMHTLVDKKTSIITSIAYFACETPYKTAQIMPVAVLLAVLFSVGQMVKHNEISAMKTSGMNVFKIARPLVIMGVLITIAVFFLNEVVVSSANRESRKIWQLKIKKATMDYGGIRDNLAFTTGTGWWIFAREFNGDFGFMNDVIGLNFGTTNSFGGNLKLRFDAARLDWQGQDKWSGKNIYWREFDIDRTMVSSKINPEMAIDIGSSPADIVQKNIIPIKQLNVLQLYDLISKLRLTGSDYREELVNFHLRFSFPFANLIMVMLGICFALMILNWRGAMVLSFAFSIIAGFFYWGFISIGIALAKNGVLAPMLGAWLGNIFFGLISLWLLYRVER